MREEEKVILKWNEWYTTREEQNRIDSKKLGKDINKAEDNQQGALSEKAYPENAHFIYEIIQNAEDSFYVNNSKAKLEFHLLDNGILVLSNQDGFTEEDIDSICLLGGGDKIAKKDQFIGEKGLGFRSVFKITDTPCISSNKYEFYFDINKMYGRVKPFLLKNFSKPLPDKFKSYEYTTIFLPYSIDENKIYDLENDFKSKIKPKVILFLKKLNQISVIKNNKPYMYVERQTKKNENFEISRLTNNDIKQTYYIARKPIDVSDVIEKRRKGIKEREIVLAFPKDVEYDDEVNLFAFLPTDTNSRLNFTIQADFLLNTDRGKIDENEWNQNLFREIKIFFIENIDKFQTHSKLKFSYLKYYLQKTKSDNKFIDTFYNQIINEIRNKDLILTDNESWQKTKNIILFEENIQIDTKYLKLLFGANYEQVHAKFVLDSYFINRFNIKKITKQELLEYIYNYLDKYNNLDEYNSVDVLYLTKIISKYLKLGSGKIFDENYFKKIKKSLPILPKYQNNKKFYLYDSIYISSEYKPDFIIENIAKEQDFDFSIYNFLSNDYLDKENKNLENFIRKVIEEKKEHKNKKTIEFFTKYPTILQNYLKAHGDNNYIKILDFLIESQEDNKDRISKIPLILTQKGSFHNAIDTTYFSNDSDSDLDVIDESLFKLLNKQPKYKEFLSNVFKIRKADMINIILGTCLPWIKSNYQKRTSANDKRLIQYSKHIINNFDKFEIDQKRDIKNSLFFISSNQKNKYLKSSSIYLPQNVTEVIFNSNSIEKYLQEKSYFDFLDNQYNEIIESINEEKLKGFLQYFSFEQNIKEDDISNFIKQVNQNLDLEKSVAALELIAKSVDKKSIPIIKTFKVYSQNRDLVEIENIFYSKVENFNIPYMNSKYSDCYEVSKLKNYFLAPLKDVEPYIECLENIDNYRDAENIYLFLDRNSKGMNENQGLSESLIRKLFNKKNIILDENNNHISTSECAWTEQKSQKHLAVLSEIYDNKLRNFFIHKIGISNEKTIYQIIKDIRIEDTRNKEYYALLVDLNDLIEDVNAQSRYYKDIGNQDALRDFTQALTKERIFILDDGSKNKNNKFYFNDLNIEYTDKSIESRIFSVDASYPHSYYKNIIDNLNIERLSSLDKNYSNKSFEYDYNIYDFRQMLHFAYDLLFTKFPDEYKYLNQNASKLEELNLINKISIYQDIISQITVDTLVIELEEEKSYFRNNELFIVDEKDLFKIISEQIGSISDKDIKDFFREVINPTFPKHLTIDFPKK